MSKLHKILILSTFAVFLVTMFFGLRPKGFTFLNNVQWLPGRPGIHFEKYSVAYANLDKIQDEKNRPCKSDFSIEIGIEPEVIDRERFRVILALQGVEDSNQIIIGQWGSYIIAMNGDDYINKNKTRRRLEAKISATTLKPVFISLSTGKNGTNLYVDGQSVISTEEPVVLPKGNHLLLTLGNSVYGQRSWQGNLLGVSLYAQELTLESIRSHFNRWVNTKTFDPGNDANPLLNYLFDENKGAVVSNNAGDKYPLIIPTWMHLFKKNILVSPWTDFAFNENFIQDLVLNLIGFMPLGFCLCELFVIFGKNSRKQAILLSMGLCFLVSLAIEIAQAWIPSRSSQFNDVLFNTLGALAGANVLTWLNRVRVPTK